MAKKIVYKGSVSLIKNKKGEGLNTETIIRNGKKGVFIPIDENPSVYVKINPDGSKIINIDIEVVPTPNNQYGNSHYVTLDVGKANREKYGIQSNQLRSHKPIVGNLRQFEYDVPDQNGQQGGYQGGYQGDMPADIADQPAAPEQFDGSW